MTKKWITLEKLAPVGADVQKQLRWTGIALAASALWSLRGLLRIVRSMKILKDYIDQGVFSSVDAYPRYVSSAFFGFALLSLVLAGLAVWNYASFRRGARTDYLMRRLPDRWEYHRRCLTVPLLGIAASVLAALTLYVLYRAVYWRLFREAAAGVEDPMRLISLSVQAGQRGLWR